MRKSNKCIRLDLRNKTSTNKNTSLSNYKQCVSYVFDQEYLLVVYNSRPVYVASSLSTERDREREGENFVCKQVLLLCSIAHYTLYQFTHIACMRF